MWPKKRRQIALVLVLAGLVVVAFLLNARTRQPNPIEAQSFIEAQPYSDYTIEELTLSHDQWVEKFGSVEGGHLITGVVGELPTSPPDPLSTA